MLMRYTDVAEGGTIMIQLTVLYGQPQDGAAFDRYYQGKHAALVQKIPGLEGFVVTKPVALDAREPSPHYVIANLYFEDMATLQSALQSPEGQATANDLRHFATGGAILEVGEVRVYSP